MRFACFNHSLISDWNHSNAHFLRGVVTELQVRGHDVRVFEPRTAWSVTNLLKDHGEGAISGFHAAYPRQSSTRYDAGLDLEVALDAVDVVIVHEWTDPALVARIGAHRARGGRYALLFHDTHHRSITAPMELAAFDLRNYDGVLAVGEVIRERYLECGWAHRVWTWHEAADIRRFSPASRTGREGDLVWIGSWSEERARQLHEMVIEPAAYLRLRARAHGSRYPEHAQQLLASAGVEYRGWLPNFSVPSVFARHALTVHVPSRPYVDLLPGIPAIRVFEALACGIPLICAPWSDAEHLFTPNDDYLVARDGDHMKHLLQLLLNDRTFATQLAANGRRTILAKHTCAHRVDELLGIVAELRQPSARHKEAS